VSVFMAGTLAMGLGAFGVYRVMSRTIAQSPSATIAPTPAVAATSSALGPVIEPAQAKRTASVAIQPGDATVTIDGAEAPVHEGAVEVTGSLGSVHKMLVKKGASEKDVDVILSEAGPNPARIDLDPPAPSASSSAKSPPPGAKGRSPASSAAVATAPSTPPTPKTSAPATPAGPTIKEKFE
jgi:hypothetical protein